MSTHLIQIIRSNHLYVIHEYMFGVRKKTGFGDISELSRELRCRDTPDAVHLTTIHGSDKTVRDASDY